MMRSVLFVAGIFMLFGCAEVSQPKQHGFPKIDFPAHRYEPWGQPGSPFTFDKPVYANMVPDGEEEHWYNLRFTPFDATLHLSYRTFRTPEELDTLVHDTRMLVYKHTIKASDILDHEIPDSNGRTGMFYELEGETATSCNFFLTDSKSRFFRGALYFNNYTTIDSVGPVVDFIKYDIHRMIRSFRFR